LAADLKPGDYVFDFCGEPQEVLSVQSYVSPDCYEVTFDDGLSLIGDRHQALELQTVKWRDRHAQWLRNQGSPFAKKRFRRPLERRTLAELHGGTLRHKHKWEYSLQNTDPLRYPQVDLPVPPYILGLWFGSKKPSGNHKIEPANFNRAQKRARQVGFNLLMGRGRASRYTHLHIRPSVRESFTFAGAPIPDMIPQSYLQADLDSRLALFDGLVDAEYIRKSQDVPGMLIARDTWREIRRLQQLVEGLGMVSRLLKDPGDTKYKLHFRPRNENSTKNRRFLRKIEKIGSKMCVHVECERKFVVGEGFLVVC
jgi:hypothetical protein